MDNRASTFLSLASWGKPPCVLTGCESRLRPPSFWLFWQILIKLDCGEKMQREMSSYKFHDKGSWEEERNYLEIIPQRKASAWPRCLLDMMKSYVTEPVQVPAAGKPSVSLSIFLGTTINWPQGTNVASLVPVLGVYLSQPAGSGLPPGLSVPRWQCWGPPGPGATARLVWGWNNQPKAVVEPSIFIRILERCGPSEMYVPTVLTIAVFLKYKGIFFPLGTKEFYAELTE